MIYGESRERVRHLLTFQELRRERETAEEQRKIAQRRRRQDLLETSMSDYYNVYM